MCVPVGELLLSPGLLRGGEADKTEAGSYRVALTELSAGRI